MIDKEKKNDYRFDVNFKDVSKCDKRSEVMKAVQQFSEYGVRIGDAVKSTSVTIPLFSPVPPF